KPWRNHVDVELPDLSPSPLPPQAINRFLTTNPPRSDEVKLPVCSFARRESAPVKPQRIFSWDGDEILPQRDRILPGTILPERWSISVSSSMIWCSPGLSRPAGCISATCK